MSVARSLEDYLNQHAINYEIVGHRETVSAAHTAAAAHIPGDKLAKPVILEDETGYVMAVVPSTHRVDLGELHRQLTRNLGLATERELGGLFPDCDLGAIPAVGAVYGMETLIDDSLAEQSDVYFEAGDHKALIHLSREQFTAVMAGSRHGRFSHHV